MLRALFIPQNEVEVAKFVTRLSFSCTVLVGAFINAVGFGWWKPNLSTPLRAMLEFVIPGVAATTYCYLESAWWRTRITTDREGIDQDFKFACLAFLNIAVVLAYVLGFRGLNLGAYGDVYVLGMFVTFAIPLCQDIGTSFLAKAGVGRFHP